MPSYNTSKDIGQVTLIFTTISVIFYIASFIMNLSKYDKTQLGLLPYTYNIYGNYLY